MKLNKIRVGLTGNLWFNRADDKFLGKDRIRLLQKIDERGAITKAANAADISFNTAWDTISQINNMAEDPLADRMTGGKGGGTCLTVEGKIVDGLITIQEKHRKFLDILEDRFGDTDSLY